MSEPEPLIIDSVGAFPQPDTNYTVVAHPIPVNLEFAGLPPEIEKAVSVLVNGAASTGDQIDSLLNVIECQHNELRAKGAKLKELTKKSADQFAQEAKEFLASMHKLELTFENEAKRVNGD